MLSVEQRVYTLSYLWKEAEYNFAFWDMHKDIDWDKTYRDYLPKVINAKDDFEYFCLLERFYATLKDGHTCVIMPDGMLDEFSVPVNIGYYDGVFYLTAVPKGEEAHLLKKLVSVNNIPIADFIEDYVNPYYWHEVPLSLYKRGGGIVRAAKIAFRDDNKVSFETECGSFTVSLHDKREVINAEFKQMTYGDVSTIFDGESCKIMLTADNIGVIRIPAFYSESLVDDVLSVKTQLQSADAIIIDLRGNGGGMGNPPFHLSQLFFGGEYECKNDFKTPSHNAQLHALEPYLDMNKIDTDEWKHRDIYKVKTHTYYERDDGFTENFDYYDTVFTQPVVIITDCFTACAAEGMVDYFNMAKRAVTVGSRTYGSGSEAMIRDLEGGAKMWLGTTWTKLCSGEEFVNVGIAPDVEIENTLNDELNGYDRVFDKACEIAKSKIKAK